MTMHECCHCPSCCPFLSCLLHKSELLSTKPRAMEGRCKRTIPSGGPSELISTLLGLAPESPAPRARENQVLCHQSFGVPIQTWNTNPANQRASHVQFSVPWRVHWISRPGHRGRSCVDLFVLSLLFAREEQVLDREGRQDIGPGKAGWL
jgi:hypothetical protein